MSAESNLIAISLQAFTKYLSVYFISTGKKRLILHFPFKPVPVMKEFCNIFQIFLASFEVSPMAPKPSQEHATYLVKIPLQPKAEDYEQ